MAGVKAKRLLLSFLILTLMAGCASYFESLDNEQKIQVLPFRPQLLSCPNTQAQIRVLGKNTQGLEIFVKSIPKIIEGLPRKRALSLEEYFTLLSLYQMNLRPDLVSPYSRAQVLFMKKREVSYWDFNNVLPGQQEIRTPLMQGLVDLLAQNSKNYSIKELAQALERSLPENIPVGSGFASFLEKSKEQIAQTESLREKFFKGDQIAVYGESISRASFSRIVAATQVKPKKRASDPLPFTLKAPNGVVAQCNLDLNLYAHGVFLIEESQNVGENAPYGLVTSEGDFFIAATNLNKDEIKSVAKTMVLEGKNRRRPIPLCVTSSKDKNMALFSFYGRDPGQFLYHMLQYDIESANNASELVEFVRFPRHQFLTHPSRMLYESGVGGPQQLSNFLGMDFPIYHADGLGEVWAVTKIGNQTHVALDPRRPSDIACQH
jgi:hypothetical protein